MGKSEKVDTSRRRFLTGSFLKRREEEAEAEAVEPVAETEEAYNPMREGNAAYDAGDWELAAERYRAASELEPNNMEMRFRLGRSFYEIGKYIPAKVEFERVLYHERENNPALLHLGLCLLRLGKPDKVVGLWKRFQDYDNINLQREVNVQLAFLETGDAPPAEEVAQAVEKVLHRQA